VRKGGEIGGDLEAQQGKVGLERGGKLNSI
jgi:hypothetical protein